MWSSVTNLGKKSICTALLWVVFFIIIIILLCFFPVLEISHVLKSLTLPHSSCVFCRNNAWYQKCSGWEAIAVQPGGVAMGVHLWSLPQAWAQCRVGLVWLNISRHWHVGCRLAREWGTCHPGVHWSSASFTPWSRGFQGFPLWGEANPPCQSYFQVENPSRRGFMGL